MKTIWLLFVTLPLFSMEDIENFTRERSHSLTIRLENSGIVPLAYDVVHAAMRDDADDRLVNIINTAIVKNYQTHIYADLPVRRQQLKENKIGSRDEVIKYLVHELAARNDHTARKRRVEQHQRYVIACIGACSTCTTAVLTTLIASATTALCMYYFG